MSLILIRYILLSALRDKLVSGIVVFLILATSLSVFVGSSAVIEKDQFSLIFTASILRFIGVFGLTIFIVFYIRRVFDHKEVEFLLSRPITRTGFLASHAASFTILALFIALVQAICVYVAAPALWNDGTVIWLFSILIENIIMVHVALFFSMVLTHAITSSMAVLGLYVLCRMMGQVLGVVDHGIDIYNLKFLETVMQAISSVMPRLDLLGQSSWLVYGPDDTIGIPFMIAQGVVVVFLFLSASLFDLGNRQF